MALDAFAIWFGPAGWNRRSVIFSIVVAKGGSMLGDVAIIWMPERRVRFVPVGRGPFCCDAAGDEGSFAYLARRLVRLARFRRALRVNGDVTMGRVRFMPRLIRRAILGDQMRLVRLARFRRTLRVRDFRIIKLRQRLVRFALKRHVVGFKITGSGKLAVRLVRFLRIEGAVKIGRRGLAACRKALAVPFAGKRTPLRARLVP